MSEIQSSTAFVLGAGLGTRLRPLTENLPKPLVPLGGRPLVTYAFDQLQQIGIRKAVINTHHAAESWDQAFPLKTYQNLELVFKHEPVLLDTGGGIKNVEEFFNKEPSFFVYNGDVLATIPLDMAWKHHIASKNLATMVLRSSGGPLHVALDAQGLISDIRGMIRGQEGKYLFTGIHIIDPRLFSYIPEIKKESIVPIYLRLIKEGLRIGGVVIDQGEWHDIGSIAEYEKMNALLERSRGTFL
jgi:mannose-1-phosphate guanylyltransferase